MSKIVALIPARGGSKGIPLKNLKKIEGIPLVARSVLAARAAKFVDSVYVSSDSEEILAAGLNAGAIPIFRPSVFASDHSSTEDVLFHFCNLMIAQETTPEILVYLQCTSPFTKPSEVDLVIETLLKNESIDCTFSAIEDHGFIWQIQDGGIAQGVNHSAYTQRQRRQDLKVSYRETGAVYAMRVEKLLKNRNRFGGKALPVHIDKSLPFEIDTPFDLELARAVAPVLLDVKFIDNLEKIKAVIFDFDGVMTDDNVFVNESGQESVRCSRADGLGVELLKANGMRVLILTREENPVVLRRAEKIGSEIINGARNKLELLIKWSTTNKISPQEILYVGNDVNDLKCMEWSGVSVAPNDAHPAVLASGALRLRASGGGGVVREIAELILQGKYKKI